MSSVLPKVFDMHGLRVLITGAAGGIGSQTDRLCSHLGATTVLTDVGSTLSGLKALASSMEGVDAAGNRECAGALMQHQALRLKP